MYQILQASEPSSFGHVSLAVYLRGEGDYWDNWRWLAGAKKLVVIKKRPASLRWKLWEVFSESTEAGFLREPRLYFVLWLDLVLWKIHPGGPGFEGMKWSWRTVKALHCVRLSKAISEDATSDAIEGPRLKESCKELRLGTMKKSQWEAGYWWSLVTAEDIRVL